MSNEEIVRRYARAVAERDAVTAASLRHERWAASLPQTGERVTSGDGLWALLDEGEAAVASDPDPVTPGAPVVAAGRLERVAGDGDAWAVERLARAADGRERFVVTLVTLDAGLVRDERIYLADRFDPGPRPASVKPDHGSMRPDDPLRDRPG